ncbi:DNA processing protein DprA [Bifidobacterium sp. DSM 109958]|uniref:DNA processing protein DprA n=1 Tax=Bifidobacterium moraviense TaxID=2675323 RepID=A0A7Y0HXJ2_9BIFI|nr:DNA-processing protein DprA [Bifidobacterium sp. DSM 109958]NMM99466.1 DNA processing protein DprA [Bifidobacterium sp. DSM 109958]
MSARYAAVDDETLARAVLAHCVDGPDALMYAALKGAPDAMTLADAIVDVHGSRAGASSGRGAAGALDEMFLTGTARWGRRVNATGLERFHAALDGWMRRLDTLPSLRTDDLRSFLCADGAMWIIAPHHPCWPGQLEDLSERADWAAPLCLWGQGDPAALTSCEGPVAVVGSRGATEYGCAVAHDVGAHAALRGHLIVSGGAFGADAAAHWGALAAAERYPDRAGRTVAVFAGGLEHIGPQRNRHLFDRIVASSGALISEMSPQTVPEARRFLLRNRLIAALARTVVVAQARRRSGALNTANWAAELNREVYAAPGDITQPGNTGCNMLIHENRAIILVDSEDVTEICHDDHMPRPPGDAADFAAPMPRTEPASSRLALGSGGRVPSSEAPDTRPRRSPPEPDADQLRVLDAVRACRRRGRAADEDAVLETLRSRARGAEDGTEDGDAEKTERTVTLAWVTRQLGDLELAGAIVRAPNGGFTPSTGTP